MHVTTDVRYTMTLEENMPIPLAALLSSSSSRLSIQSSANRWPKASKRPASRHSVAKNTHSNGDQRFQRAGTDTRTATTTAGEHEFSLHHVRDTAADTDETGGFAPPTLRSRCTDGDGRGVVGGGG